MAHVLASNPASCVLKQIHQDYERFIAAIPAPIESDDLIDLFVRESDRQLARDGWALFCPTHNSQTKEVQFRNGFTARAFARGFLPPYYMTKLGYLNEHHPKYTALMQWMEEIEMVTQEFLNLQFAFLYLNEKCDEALEVTSTLPALGEILREGDDRIFNNKWNISGHPVEQNQFASFCKKVNVKRKKYPCIPMDLTIRKAIASANAVGMRLAMSREVIKEPKQNNTRVFEVISGVSVPMPEPWATLYRTRNDTHLLADASNFYYLPEVI